MLGEVSGCGHLVFKGVELCGGGKLAVPQEVGDLLESHDRREVFDEVSTPVDEAAVGAIDLADRGFGGDDPFQPRAEVRHEA
jgi:hypothetical protein